MKTGLVLEGGAMRGMFSCGVIDVFLENGIAFSGVAGISAGAVFGCNFKSRQIGRPIRYNKRFCADPRYGTWRSLLKTGDLYDADFCYRELPDELDVFDRAAFRQNPLQFYVGATDVDTGEAVYHLCTDGGETDMQWLRASASMPLVSRPVVIDGRRYLDGGIADAVPYQFLESQGYDRCVLVLTRPKGYRKRPSPAPLRFLLRRQPALAKAMADRHLMYNRQMEAIDQREERGQSLVIRPPEDVRIGRTEKHAAELERVYQMGRQEAERRFRDVQCFLAMD